MKKTFKECYLVSFDYLISSDWQRIGEYWNCSAKEYVTVDVVHGVNEKNNHQKAEDIIKNKFPNCKINSVTYV